MNKTFSCADDLAVNICYQDADSIHLNYDDVDKVFEKDKGKCNQDLIGTYLGDFHIDFKMNGVPKNAGIYANGDLLLCKTT